MMKRVKKSFPNLFSSLVLVGLFFSLGISPVLAGFGISPPSLKNDHLLPGSHYEQVIYLVRGEPKETLFTRIKINAPEIESWIKVEPGFEFELPKGVQQFPVKFIVDVPQNAELKLYQGTIDILTSSEKTKGGQITTALGAQAEIALRITEEQFSEFEFRLIDLADTEEGSPLKLILKIENKGNQKTGPTKAILKVFDKYHQTLLEESETEISEKVEPFQIKELSVEFPTNLTIGQYWGDFEIYQDDKLVKKDKQVFNILEKAAVMESEKEKGKEEKKEGLSGWRVGRSLYVGLGITAVLILGGAIWFFLKRKEGKVLKGKIKTTRPSLKKPPQK